ncbi:2-oxoglutarate dehydrogenase E1 component, partial [Gammaproteobacteria bacterium]|nr:2-oxoglutarate dehydrogenase E1 component [Gammaproteobacteria bacterium]
MKKQKTMQELQDESYLSGGSDSYLDSIYDGYLKNPDTVDPEWSEFFSNLNKDHKDISHEDIRKYFFEMAGKSRLNITSKSVDFSCIEKQEKVMQLINAYRSLGHLHAELDPLGFPRKFDNSTLDISYYDFSESDMNSEFNIDSYYGINKSSATLREIYQSLCKIYCSRIGIEYMHIMDLKVLDWIQKKMENEWNFFSPSESQKLNILDKLVAADGLEKYLGLKYVGQKRFSLEGGDSLIPMLDTIVNHGACSGLKDIVIGMAHRGRLNVLVNILGKEPNDIFANFENQVQEKETSGDVKYHLGFSTDLKTSYGPVHVSLSFNPSHLEIVSPVVQGSVRARQRRRKDVSRTMVMPIQIHGDAAFAGQGVVMETFAMSQARWFSVYGSIHIVINNQVGFTTSNISDSRSSIYCTDVAKMVQAPILHVNSNDPEAVIFAAQLACDFRSKFKKDIVIDLVCYRRHGHNEADEPSATQPKMYSVIKKLPTPAKLYSDKLISEGILDKVRQKQLVDSYKKKLEEGKSVVNLCSDSESYEYSNDWEIYANKKWTYKVDTGFSFDKLKEIARKLEKLPDNFVLQAQVRKMMEARVKMTDGDIGINWGYAEVLAYATLLVEGYPIRLCGQDSGRGTFSHRHAVLYDQNTAAPYIPLSCIKP